MHYYRDPAKLSGFIIAGALTLFAHQAQASGFFLHEQNASLLGGFYAGGAAIAEDASTNFLNPAGLTNLEGINFVVSGVNVSTDVKFKGTTTLTTLSPATGTETETGSANGGTARLVPAVHASYRINDKWAAGLSISAPFGLATDYNQDSIVRYHATLSQLKTINITPAVAFKPVEWFSVGVGFDALYADAELNAMLGLANLAVPDVESVNKADDWAFGWHAGVLAIVPQTGTHLGLNFHSEYALHLKGRSKTVGTGSLAATGKSEVTGDADLPWWIEASVTHPFNDKFTVLGSVEYVHWSSIKTLELVGVQTASGPATSSDPLNYDNAWSFLLGARYQFNPNVMLSVGGAYEQTPTNDTDRDIRLPDTDRWIASVGVRWIPQSASRVQLDLGYAHLWGKKTKVDKTLEASTQTVTAVGDATGFANLIGGQITVQM